MKSTAALLVSAALLAQQPPPAAPGQESELRIRVPVQIVLVPTVVTDRDGNFITDLRPDEFALKDNGKMQKVEEDVIFHPLSMVIAVQANASMEKVLEQVRKTGPIFENYVTGETGEAAVVSFDHRVNTVQGFTDKPGEISEALKKIKPGSQSARLNDAVMLGIRMLESRPKDRRKAVVLISEARDNGSEVALREVLTRAEFAGVSVYSVNVNRFLAALTGRTEPPRPDPVPAGARRLPNGQMSTPTTESQTQMGNWVPAITGVFKGTKSLFVDNVLETYTKYTGGREFPFLSYRDLEKALTAMGDELHNQYLISYRPNNLSEAGYHEIEVIVKRPNLRVRARPGYWTAGIAE